MKHGVKVAAAILLPWALLLGIFAGLELFARWRVARIPRDSVSSGVEHPPYYNNPGVVTSPRAFGFHIKYHINSLGLRGPEIAQDKGAASRILLVGDSVVFGAMVREEDTLSMQLERLLGAAPGGRRWQVLNGGVGGYDVWDYEGFLRQKGLALAPDIVVVGLYRNDHIRRAVYDKVTAKSAPNRRWFAAMRDALLRSELLSAAQFFLQRHQDAKRPLFSVRKQLTAQDHAVIAGHFPGDPGTAAAVEKYLADYRYDPYQVKDTLAWMLDLKSWEGARAPLAGMRDLCRARHIPLLVVTLPVQFELYPGYRWPEPQRGIERMLRELGLPVLDAGRLWAAGGRGDELFRMRYDICHPDREAYRMLAEAVAAELRKRGWLGGAAGPL